MLWNINIIYMITIIIIMVTNDYIVNIVVLFYYIYIYIYDHVLLIVHDYFLLSPIWITPMKTGKKSTPVPIHLAFPSLALLEPTVRFTDSECSWPSFGQRKCRFYESRGEEMEKKIPEEHVWTIYY